MTKRTSNCFWLGFLTCFLLAWAIPAPIGRSPPIPIGNPTISATFAFLMDTSLGDSDSSFIGEAPDDIAGRTVASAGDVNGDGFDDILVSAMYNNEGGYWAGQAYLVLGNATIGAGCAKDMNLSAASASFIGEMATDFAGNSVAGAGDVNGDGFDDILIGASQNDEGGDRAGQVYLVLGNTTIGNGCAKDMNLSAASASFIGEMATDYAGNSVAGAGDVNGDGYDDILIGAFENNEGGSGAGQVYLILGNATIGNGCAKDMNLSAASASFIGEMGADFAGNSVAGAGDVNGDGFDDILIGAYFNDEGGANAGQAYLILGNATIGNGCARDMGLGAANASFIGEAADDRAGQSVAGAGNVNGDGFDDILVGAYQNDEGGANAGQAYLVLGNATIGAGCAKDMNLTTASASFIGEVGSDRAGYPVAGAGDVNGDGFDDILISAIYNYEGGDRAGQAYLVLGNATIGAGCARDMNLTAASASFIGEATEDYAGGSVAGAGDVNGDGSDDLLVSALQNDEGGSGAGQVYLLLSDIKAPARIQDLELTFPTLAGFVLSWTAPGDDNLAGTVTGYVVKYSTSPITGATFDAAATYAQAWTDLASGGTRESRVITGLNASTLYCFAINAYDNIWNYCGLISNLAVGSTSTDVEIPSVAGPEAIAYDAGTTGHSIQWALADGTTRSPTYWILRDGTEFVSPQAWPAGGIVIFPVDGFPVGTYTFTLYAADGYGNVVVDAVTVTVSAGGLAMDWGVMATIVAGIALAAVLLVVIQNRRLHKAFRALETAREVDRKLLPASTAQGGKPDPK